jgi:flavin-dependent dehydrogenase
MPTGVRLLDRLGVLARIPPERCHNLRGVSFVVNGRDRVWGDFPKVGERFYRGMGVKRFVLDHELIEHARSHPGVEIRESEAATDARWPAGGLAEVSTRQTLFRARLVVGADGVRSLIRRKLDLELRHGRHQRYGVRAHFTFSDGRSLGDYVTVYRDADAECYMTPVSSRELGVALLVERNRMRSFAGRLDRAYTAYLQAMPHLRAVIEGGERTSAVLACGPFDIWARSRVADRAILIGDAAGYLDPITGEGIALALQSAYWAAEVAADALLRDDLSARRLQPYHMRLEKAMRHYKVLTRAVLSLARHERLAGLIVRRLASCPEIFTRLLAINCGVQTFWDFRLADLFRFIFGADSERSSDAAWDGQQ